MTLDTLKHSAILTTLFKMADDNDLIGASEFVKGEFKFLSRFSLDNFDSLCFLRLRCTCFSHQIPAETVDVCYLTFSQLIIII